MKEHIIRIWVSLTYSLFWIIVLLLSIFVNIKIMYAFVIAMALVGTFLSMDVIEKKITKALKKENKK